ncbi:MAG: TspO/MBR family protein [Candidatus Jorgensenbacteria bacterium]|nr:TspO/MBR family protein [Candidatus Jorgensenbacteria bacterium]
MKLNLFVIPIITIATAVIGGLITSGGMAWYETLKLPWFTPSGNIIGSVWTVLFVLTAISAIIFYNAARRNITFSWVIVIFILNAILNVAWSYLFFYKYAVAAATFEAGLLSATVIALVILIWQASLRAGRNAALLRLASVLLIPYAVWVIFATYLTFSVWTLNYGVLCC